MTNDQNLIRARHAEALANDISDFITQSNSDLYQALQAELADLDTSGGASGVVLGSDSSTVDGTLWLESENDSPVVKLFSNGTVYSFPTQPDFTVLDYSTATSGKRFTVTSDNTSVIGSAYNDYISITGSNNTIREGAGNGSITLKGASYNYIDCNLGNDTIRTDEGASHNTIIGDTGDNKITINGAGYNYVDCGSGSVRVYASVGNNNTVIGGVGNDTIHFPSLSNNYISLTSGIDGVTCQGSNNTVIGGDNTIEGATCRAFVALASNNGNCNYVELKTGDNKVSIGGSSGTVICGTGNDSVIIDSPVDSVSHHYIALTAGNNQFGTGSATARSVNACTIIGGTGNDRISVAYGSRDCHTYNYIALTAGNNQVRGFTSCNTIIGGTGNDSIHIPEYKDNDSSVGVSPSVKAGRNYVVLTSGNNTLSFGCEDNTIYGGLGDDSIYLNDAHNYIDLKAGNNTVMTEWETNSSVPAGFNTIICGTGNDKISLQGGFSTNNYVNLVTGNNTVNAFSKSNTIIGGTGDDYIYAGGMSGYFSLNAGDNTVSASGANLSIMCGSGNDSIYFSSLCGSEVYYFADNDTLALPTVSGTTWNASVDSSTVIITINGIADSVITLKDYTAEQFHIKKGVYTIQGSKLVPAGS